ncbi:sensor histidine kinase [Glaciihabitans arcticus]|uniref:histidine kinase n=1 Tax=Glaciihabitans arcticus TaxID=2668039 RepID=A0A4Q9GXD4_9MICO|nr:sensor histidine kinase [Glaciihabitans arcticus]TBN56930.1 sensor histidine kinase [Glaciihabitans arcticus]
MPSLRRSPHERWREAHGWTDEGGPGWYGGPWDPELAAGRFSGRTPSWVRVWLPVIISLFVQLPGSVFTFDRLAQTVTVREHALLGVAIALVGIIALVFARRWPGPVVAVVAVAAAADLLIAGDVDGPPYIALAFAIGSAIVRGARVWAWVSIAVAWIATLILSSVVGITWQPWRIVGISIGILFIVGLAEGIRTRREHSSQLRMTIARRRQSEVRAERVRIARELHDVLAHSLSQINVQAGVGLHLMEKQPEKAAAALASIKETSKTALDEVRSVLGVLRAEDGADPSAPLVPEPDLSRLAGLVASVSQQGVDVTLNNTLTDIPRSTQLALYRIVQESLTNVVRHAHASRAVVELDEDAGFYVVAVRDDGTGPVEPTHGSGGRGLLGMRERAELLGGTLDAAPRPGGGFAVTARIPKRENPE